jgi:hypothetical protein
MIARANQIAEEKGGEKSVREIDKEGSQLRGRTQHGTESPRFRPQLRRWSSHTAEESYNLIVRDGLRANHEG